MTARLEQSYWNHCGKHQSVADKLHELIPAEGSVKNPYKNKALERFRKASNLYYRLHNDGDFNVGAARMFGVDYPSRYRRIRYSEYGRMLTWAPELYEIVNAAMDGIIETAAAEQNFSL